MLEAAGIQFAVLHRERDVAREVLRSDIDLVVEGDPRRAVYRCLDGLHRVGLKPIVVLSNDVALSYAVFLATREARFGVHLDFLSDAHGWGKFGIRSPAVLDAAVNGAAWPTATPLHEALYLVRKRHYKGDTERLKDAMAESRSFPEEDVHRAMDALFPARVVTDVRRVLGGMPGFSRAPRGFYRRDLFRRVERIWRPAGFWLHLHGGPEAAAAARVLARRFGALLIRGEAGLRPDGRVRAARWWLRRIVPVRWRAGLFISWAASPEDDFPAPDLAVAYSGDIDEIAEAVVAAMEAKVLLDLESVGP